MSPIRVLQVLEATVGGTKRHLLDLCTGLDPEQFDVQVACPPVRSEAHGDTSFVDDLRRAGLGVQIIPMVRRISPWRDAIAFVPLARLIARGHYDVIHAHSSKAGFLTRQAALLDRRARIAYSPHGFYFLNFGDPIRSSLFKYLEKLAGLRTHALVTLSRGEYQTAVAAGLAPAGRVRLIENGIDHVDCLPRLQARTRLDIPAEATVVGTISRFTAQKAPFVLVDVAAKLVARRPDLVFAWFSDGELRPAIEAAIAAKGLSPNFRLLGYRPDARLLLPALDVFLLASRWEGLPYTVMEAMDAGVPVVATDVVGTQDFIDDGRNGCLAPVNDPDLLAARVEELLSQPQRAANIAAAARQDVQKRYSRAEMVKKIGLLYRELVGERAVD